MICVSNLLPARLRKTAAVLACLLIGCRLADAGAVRVTEEDVIVPTYAAGDPEPNPIFYTRRGSQGAQGRVYPYPLYDVLTHQKTNRAYRVIYLENDFVRLGIMPEIGGRLFEAVDKSNGYDFIYRQHVIKPALISLIGAWISGGIEWNIPHHHRASTFLPVQYRTESNPDGSQTVWVGELEVRHRMRWAVGYTLHPDKSYLECRIRVLNRTPVANTMLCFANVAVHVNPDYQVIYPPSTKYVTFHSKVDFATWPVAQGYFNNVDFTRGVDVSWYSNHLAANSMFAWNYEDDFFAGYDHGRQAGIMSVANHYLVPGKKFWTWGNDAHGKYWDQVLTDEDGPYIELMVGAYSDNQPDYSWLHPYETRSFEMYWYPFRGIGGVKNANLEAAVNLEVTNRQARLGFCTTSVQKKAQVQLLAGTQIIHRETVSISPGKPFLKTVPIPAGVDTSALKASLEVDGRELVSYSPVPPSEEPMPEKVRPPAAPQDIKSVEELYLTGLRIEQFHSPSHDPEPYWEEALKRDPEDSRVHTAWGLRKFKQAQFAEAEEHFRQALKRLTHRYTSPKEGEPFYYLGLALQMQGKVEEAYDHFYKAAWSEAWKSPAYFALAEIRTAKGDHQQALQLVEQSLNANASNIRALTLKAALLRHLGRRQEARALLHAASRSTDPLDVRLMAEKWLNGDRSALRELSDSLREHPANALECAAEYSNAGLNADGVQVLQQAVIASSHAASPLIWYFLADLQQKTGHAEAAAQSRLQASRAEPGHLFPYQWEMIPVLRHAMAANGKDASAPCHLGNLLFDWQPEAARALWHQSVALNPDQAIAHRNLALAYSLQKPADLEKAIAHLKQAIACPVKYPLHFAELEELASAAAVDPAQRLRLLEQNHAIVTKRDDALSKEIGLKVLAGKYDDAIRLMTGRTFSVWEGGSLEVSDHWINAHILRARHAIASGQFAQAKQDLRKARHIPETLSVGHVGPNPRGSEIDWWLGVAFEAGGENAKARQAWQAAVEAKDAGRRRRQAEALSEQAIQKYYRALAWRKLGDAAQANALLEELLQAGSSALKNSQPLDRGAAPAEQNKWRNRQALAHYLAGLAYSGRGEQGKAAEAFRQALDAAPDFVPARVEISAPRVAAKAGGKTP